MAVVLQDLRYASRALARNQGLATVAVLTLALGIGANTVVFSLVEALLLRSLPYDRPERLVTLESTNPRGSRAVGPDDFRDWQAQNTVFEEMAYTCISLVSFTGQSFPGFGEPERLTGTEVSAGFFPLLGVQPLLGRWFLPEEHTLTAGRNWAIIVSHGMWLKRFGAKPDILGQSLTLNGRSYTIVGIMPENFRFNEGRVCEFWVPLQHFARGRTVHQYSAYARLKPGVPVAAAQAQMSAIARRLEIAYPETNTGWGVKVTPLRDLLTIEFGPALLVFSAAVAVVLLIACANVSSLLLARATGRIKEIAVRRALGATRFSILRLLLSESVLLAAAGAALGLLFALWGIELAIAAAPAWLELKSILHVDRNVLGFTLLLSVLAGVLAGLAPALEASRAEVSEGLKQEGGGSGTRLHRARVLSALVISEVALAVPLLISAGLLTKSFVHLLEKGVGFRTRDVLIFRTSLPWSRYREARQQAKFYRELLERVRSMPGVTSAGAVNAIPMASSGPGGAIEVEGRPMPRDWTEARAWYREATPDYFRTLDIPLRKGRYFTDQDRNESEPVIIVDEALARQFFPQEDPIGKKIRFQPYTEKWWTIVGVVGDVRHRGPEDAVVPTAYCAYAQSPSGEMYVAVRTAVAPSSLTGAIRAEVRALDRDLPVTELRTMEQGLSESLALRRHMMALVGFLAAVALVMAALGLAGVMWYGVSQRTHEIGVRMALGAQQRDVLRLVLRQGLRLTFAGLAIGLGATYAVTHVLASALYGVSPKDPVVFALTPALLGTVALAACYLPARRAATVDPMRALRQE